MAGEQSSRKRHRFFLENSEEFTLEVEEDDGTTATTTITTTIPCMAALLLSVKVTAMSPRATT